MPHGVNCATLRFLTFLSSGYIVTLLLKFALSHPKRKRKIKRTIVPVIKVSAIDQGHRLISLSSQLFVTLELFLKVLRLRMQILTIWIYRMDKN
jgi:hypothetical protein